MVNPILLAIYPDQKHRTTGSERKHAFLLSLFIKKTSRHFHRDCRKSSRKGGYPRQSTPSDRRDGSGCHTFPPPWFLQNPTTSTDSLHTSVPQRHGPRPVSLMALRHPTRGRPSPMAPALEDEDALLDHAHAMFQPCLPRCFCT